MATKWARFAEDGDRYDLQYRTVGDNKVRDAHRQLNSYVAPLNSAFWDSYYPPNGWGCRCDVQQVRKGKYTNTITDEEATSAGAQSTVGDKQRIFRTNPGKLKKVFPPKHPNFPKGCEGCNKNVTLAFGKGNSECKACKIIQSVNKQLARKIEYNAKLAEKLRKDGYINVEFNENTGALMATHPGHNFDHRKGRYEVNVQKAGFKAGNSVILEKEDHTIMHKRNTEGLWNGKTFEIKACETGTVTNICRGLKHAVAKNADIAVVYFEENFDKEVFEKALARYDGLKDIKGQWKPFDNIICIKGETIVYKKSHL